MPVVTNTVNKVVTVEFTRDEFVDIMFNETKNYLQSQGHNVANLDVHSMDLRAVSSRLYVAENPAPCEFTVKVVDN